MAATRKRRKPRKRKLAKLPPKPREPRARVTSTERRHRKLGISPTTKRRVATERREIIKSASRVVALAGDRPVQINFYLRPSTIKRIKVASIDRDAAVTLMRAAGHERTAAVIDMRGASGLVEQVMSDYFAEIERRERELLEERATSGSERYKREVAKLMEGEADES